MNSPKTAKGIVTRFAYLRAHPEHLIKMLPAKLFWLYHTDTSGLYEGVLEAPMQAPSPLADWFSAHRPLTESLTFRYYAGVMVVAVAGLFLALIRYRNPWTLAIISLPLMLTFFHIFFHAKDRFHITVDGVFAVLAAIAVVEAYRLVQAAAMSRPRSVLAARHE